MIIVKIGGGAAINLPAIVSGLAKLNEPLIIIHGANALRDQLAQVTGKPKKVITSVSGHSSVFSDSDALDLLMMAYAGLRNKRLVELCQRHGINAIGLSGLDGKLVQGRRNRGIRVREENKLRLLHDFSGKPVQINFDLIKLLIGNGYIPVITVPIIDENGFAINSENDDIVALLQQGLQARMVIQLIEAPGLLENAEDEDTLIPALSSSDLEEMESRVAGRMKRKIYALRKLCKNLPATVIICDGRTANPIDDALNGKGTHIS